MRDARQFGGGGVWVVGSMINLSVGRLEVDWGRNAVFTDHSQLFPIVRSGAGSLLLR